MMLVMAKNPWRIQLKFLWYDFWVGAYFDREKRTLYICPLPMCVVKIWSEPRG